MTPGDVQRVIDLAGMDITYKAVSSAYNVSTATNVETVTSYTVQAAVRMYRKKEIAGLIQQGDREVRIAAAELAVTPKHNDRVTVAGKDLAVISVNVLAPFNAPMLHILQVRG